MCVSPAGLGDGSVESKLNEIESEAQYKGYTGIAMMHSMRTRVEGQLYTVWGLEWKGNYTQYGD